MLLGIQKEEQWNVKEIILTKNVENPEVEFTISPEELLAGYQACRRKTFRISRYFSFSSKINCITIKY